jgi:hypothetical protein
LLSFADIDALLKHLTQLGKVFESSLELVKDLGTQGVMLIHHMLVQVATQLLQCENHVVNLHAVNQLGIISKLSLYSVEFCVELFKIWELYNGLECL